MRKVKLKYQHVPPPTPFFVTSQLFYYCSRCIEPAYVVPSHTHISSICRKQYHAVKEQVSVSLESTSSVALTTEVYTSRIVQSYITVTVHFLTEDWILHSRVLVTVEC